MKPKKSNIFRIPVGRTYAMKVGPDSYVWGQAISHQPNGLVEFIIRVRAEDYTQMIAGLGEHGRVIIVPEANLEHLEPPNDLMKIEKWAVYHKGPNIHILPMAEWEEHAMAGDCQCGPAVEYQGTTIIVVHNATPGYPGQARPSYIPGTKTRLN